MRIVKFAAAASAIVGMMTAATAYAGQSTRSASALPSAKVAKAPVTSVRSSKDLKKESKLSGPGIGIGIAAAVAIGLGILVAVDGDDEADSPG